MCCHQWWCVYSAVIRHFLLRQHKGSCLARCVSIHLLSLSCTCEASGPKDWFHIENMKTFKKPHKKMAGGQTGSHTMNWLWSANNKSIIVKLLPDGPGTATRETPVLLGCGAIPIRQNTAAGWMDPGSHCVRTHTIWMNYQTSVAWTMSALPRSKKCFN